MYLLKLEIFIVIAWKRTTSTSFKMHPSVFHRKRKSGTFLETNIIFLGWTITLEIFWATTCAVDTARLHNCKQVTTASSCSSELQSHVAQSNPSYYGLQNTFHKRIKKTLVGPFAQAKTAPGGGARNTPWGSAHAGRMVSNTKHSPYTAPTWLKMAKFSVANYKAKGDPPSHVWQSWSKWNIKEI